MPETAPDLEGVPANLASGLVDALDDHIAVVDGDGRVILANEAWTEFGRSEEWAADRVPAGTDYLKICRQAAEDGDEQAREFAERFEAILAGDRKTLRLKYPCHGPEGDRWFVCSASRLEGVEEAMVVVTHHDVTERKTREERIETLIEELEVSNRELERFAHTVSHDLKQPIRTVHQFVEILDQKYSDELPEDAREYITFAVEGADRAVELVDSLLELSRVDSKGSPLEPTDLGTVVEHVVQDLSVRIEETDAEIEVGELPRVMADPDQVGDLIGNLVRNAIDYCGDEPPRIEIFAERSGDRWTVAVADEGIGIAEERQETIFEAFERGESGKGPAAGSGIGLAIARRIVERHDGTIWVDSELGEGSTFYFTLPAIPDEEE